jgi:hypothetical protein
MPPMYTDQDAIRQRVWDYLLGTERKRKLTVNDVLNGNEMFNAGAVGISSTSDYCDTDDVVKALDKEDASDEATV